MHPLKLRLTLPLAVLVALLIAVVLASRGGAAGTNICPSSGPSCLNVFLMPGQLRAGSDGVQVARFQNQGNSTATHTTVSETLPAGAVANSITSSPAATCSLSTLSCFFGNIAGHGLVKVYVRFTATSSSANPVGGTATATFNERNDSSPTVDTITVSSNAISINASTATGVNGACTTNGSQLKAFTSAATINAVYPSALGSLGLPCTPVDTGVGGNITGFTEKVVFVDLPQLGGNGLATITLDYTTLPTGVNVNTFKLYEIPLDSSQAPIQVPACSSGAPPAGYDSCISGRKKFGTKGIELTLLVVGTGGDPKFAG